MAPLQSQARVYSASPPPRRAQPVKQQLFTVRGITREPPRTGTFLPQQPAGVGAIASKTLHERSQFTWDRNSQWVEVEPQQNIPPPVPLAPRPTPPTSARIRRPVTSAGNRAGAVPPLNSPTALRPPPAASKHSDATQQHAPIEPGQQAPPETAVAPLAANEPSAPPNELWSHVVLPAVTWLYGWVEWQMGSTHVGPANVEGEYRLAFAAATEQVTEAMRNQPDRLAACIWRAMVALLTHFVTRVEPLQNALNGMQDQAADDQKEIAELKLALADAESKVAAREEEEITPPSTGRLSPSAKRPSLEDTSLVKRVSLDLPDDSTPPDTPSRQGSQRKPSLRRRNSHDEREAELEVTRAELIEAKRDLMIERAEKESLQQALSRQKSLNRRKSKDNNNAAIVRRESKEEAKVVEKAPTSVAARSPSPPEEEEEEAPAEEEMEVEEEVEELRGKDRPKGKYLATQKRGEAVRRGTLVEVEDNVVQRLEEELAGEKSRCMFLEQLRVQMMAQLGDGYVLSLEEQLRTGTAFSGALYPWNAQGGDAQGGIRRGSIDGLVAADVIVEEDRPPTLTPALPAPPSRSNSIRECRVAHASTQYEKADATLAAELAGVDPVEAEDDDEDDEDDDDEEGKGKRKSLVRKPEGLPSGSKKRSTKLLSLKQSSAATALNMRQMVWTVQKLFDDKMKRDAVDELEHRQKQLLSTFVPDHFVHKHGMRDLAQKSYASFVEGVRAAANGGNRRVLVFALLAGYIPFPEDEIGAMTDPGACTFYLETERKAMRASGADSDRSDGSPVWLPLDRAIELMRNEFRQARPADTAKFTADVEELLRLPEEINEVTKLKDQTNSKQQAANAKQAGQIDERSGLPMATDVLYFREKPEEEQTRITRRRQDALVQNKVLRAIARRGLTLRETFDFLDKDGSNEIDPDEFVAGIQSLDGGLTDAQCQRLMVQIDTDNSGTVDYSELTRALQKLDLRVEMHDFLVVCMRFFSLEMQRSAELLKAKFSAAVQKAMERPDSASSLGGSPQGARARPKSAGSAEGQLDGEGVTQLLKTMNAPFAPAVVQRLLANMHSAQQDEAKAKGRSQSEKRPSIAALDPETYYNCSAFVKVCMAYGFHAQSSPAFKEDTKRIATATNTMMAVNMFAKKMGKKTARAGSAERKALPMPTPGAAAAPAAAAPAEAAAPAAAADLLLLSLKEAAATEAAAPAAAD